MENKVQRWLQYVERRNRRTAETYRRCITRFEKTTGQKVQSLLSLTGVKRRKLLETYLEDVSHLTPNTQSLLVNVIKTFLNFNGKTTRLTVKITGQNRTPTIVNERVPEPKQVREILNRLELRDRVSASLIALAGLRFETQISLTVGDLLDLDIQNLVFKRTPALIHIPSQASKNRRQYFSFLVKEGCEVIEAYLKNRRAKGEDLTETSPLLARLNGKRLTVTQDIRTKIRKVTKAVMNTRPYALRSYFNTSLLAAGVHPDWKRFFTGHTGDIEDVYSTRKHLPDWAIEKMREQFQPAEKQLTTLKPDIQEQQKAAAIAALQTLQTVADQFGINIADIEKVRHRLEAATLPA
ncbi:MAG: tyrosine-type recombinase/integrase [Nitrososphaerales archaeon]